MHISAIILLASTLLLSACGIPAIELPSVSRHYTPIKTLCPEGTLVRPATGLSTQEMEYRAKRKRVADEALKRWLVKTKDGFDVDRIEVPTIGLTTSGGGYRSFLVGAGVIQGLDERDSNETTGGLFQALTYQAGLSGGSWLLSSLAGNNYPTVTQLKNVLWVEGFQNGLLQPGGSDSGAYEEIALDITEKRAAGFETTLTDPYGRLLSYQLFAGPDYGGNLTLSSITEMSSFTSHAVPYPVIVSLGVKIFSDECIPGPNGTIYEFTPFEFGSWDSDVNAFTSLKYLGTSLSNGEPLAADDCTANYDNLGYILGTSSHVFNMVCSETLHDSWAMSDIVPKLKSALKTPYDNATENFYAVYPNPFYNYTSASMAPNSANLVSAQAKTHLVDGGEASQNNPIWPMLQPPRELDVLFVNDNSADTPDNFPNGTAILTTYVQTLNHDLTRMPYVPSVETFIERGLNKRATFFGCSDTNKITIIYLPNVAYNFPSNVPTAKLQYSRMETDAMIENGMAVATQNGEEGWGICVACAILAKTNTNLPTECEACFAKYCYYADSK